MKVMVNYLVHPEQLVSKAKGFIDGFNEMVRDEEIPQWDIINVATEVAEEWTNDWDEDYGFGSSDGTYMLKDFIDTVINSFTDGKYKTAFNPTLKVMVG